MGSISSLGVGSGIDLQSLVDGLVSAERSVAEAGLNRREVQAAERLSAFGLIKSAVSE
ncbi:MAG: flagellar hook-associated protein 2, partial [Pseudomonadales bacterium]|nr:flagellar hook-associated protein 2 [Pseudomonadales bacterium]